MAVIDWPTMPAFAAAEFRLGLDVSELQFQGFRTGNRTRQSNLVDRMTCTVMLPPCLPSDAGEREAFIMGMRSSGDWVRFGMPHRPVPAGTLAGAPLVNSARAAGSRDVALTKARTAKNLLVSPRAFERNDWAPAVNPAGVTVNTFGAPSDGQIYSDTLTDSSSSVLQTREQVVNITSSSATYCCSIYVRKTTGGTAPSFAYRIQLDGGTPVNSLVFINTDSGVVLFGSAVVQNVATNWWRVSTTVTDNASGNTTATMTIFPAAAPFGGASGIPTTTGSATVADAQLELGSAVTAFEGMPTLAGGDLFEIGGNLLMVAAGGATTAATGIITVPLALPLQTALAGGEAATLMQPRGVWEFDADTFELVYTPGRVQGAIALPFRQVPQ